MPLEARKYLYDIQQAIELIEGGFCSIDDRIVWGVIEGRLPQLRREVAQLLSAESD